MRRDKQAMLRRAFERIGFTVVDIERDQYGSYCIYFIKHPVHFITVVANDLGLNYQRNGCASISVRWTAAFDRWYAANVDNDTETER